MISGHRPLPLICGRPAAQCTLVKKQLQPKTYLFRNDGNYANVSLPTGQQYGFMAADLEKAMPAAVTDTPIFTKNGDGEATVSETIRAVNYNMLIPVLTQAIKELEAKVEALEAKLGAGNGVTAVKAGRLLQNKPNPADGNTVIGYELPAGISSRFRYPGRRRAGCRYVLVQPGGRWQRAGQ